MTHWYNRPMRITYRQSRDVHSIGEAAYLDKHRDTPAGSSDPRVEAWHASQQAERMTGCRHRRQCAARERCTVSVVVVARTLLSHSALVDLVRFSLRAVLHITSTCNYTWLRRARRIANKRSLALYSLDGIGDALFYERSWFFSLRCSEKIVVCNRNRGYVSIELELTHNHNHTRTSLAYKCYCARAVSGHAASRA